MGGLQGRNLIFRTAAVLWKDLAASCFEHEGPVAGSGHEQSFGFGSSNTALSLQQSFQETCSCDT